MRKTHALLFAGIGAIGLVGSAEAAQNDSIHNMTVRLPGGGIERIQYAGDTAPQAMLDPMAADPAFAEMARISAMMDRQMDAMMSQTQAAAFGGVPVMNMSNLAPGAAGYSMISVASGSDVCTHTMQVTTSGKGQPQVVRHSYGNCSAAADTFAAPQAQSSLPKTIQADAQPHSLAPIDRQGVVRVNQGE